MTRPSKPALPPEPSERDARIKELSDALTHCVVVMESYGLMHHAAAVRAREALEP